ncbi:MAG: class I poly(R)-hydroxyalkanoic acid synthase [Sphingomonadaceae bacterium]|uniref:PHA/PHB synthase family protein n=1 Tax=Thermaurantiacus sp. TaxID=2820283 RepID=UPI00298EDDB5|nr:class I poly(R)-hydroxyalkanoic acid synthase [Thermaurantiacus sp.]MCS6986875.1 class I poly(R)-hydroxyalkanoic acid synthase [Sphingomonadaceae bacterium]MDW8415525.1 class I poly(R)-hydroxyalkanoic acid synthase [Thermaurantiacus sp.]
MAGDGGEVAVTGDERERPDRDGTAETHGGGGAAGARDAAGAEPGPGEGAAEAHGGGAQARGGGGAAGGRDKGGAAGGRDAAGTEPGPGEDSAADPLTMFQLFLEASGKAQQALVEAWARAAIGRNATEGGRAAQAAAGEATGRAAPWFAPVAQWSEAARALMGAPAGESGQALAQLWADWWTDWLKLWSGLVTGREEDIPAPARRADRRFAGEAWSSLPLFDFLKRSYLLASHYWLEAARRLGPVPEPLAERVRFHVKQMVEALSPANFPTLNPEVIRLAQETRGESLVRGLEYLIRDIRQGKLTMTDETAFEVGQNVAATPGKVVFRNRMFELIQYAPTTQEVHEIPLLIFPPWINKYYILDLTPEKSFVRWAVERGLTVFIVSWAQASPRTADATLDTYVEEGFLEAIRVVRAICGTSAVNAIGYCVAGTTLAIVLAYLAATGEAEQVRSATFFTAQTDFSEAGELLNFVDDAMLQTIEGLGRDGVFDGRYLALTFNLLRPTDLLWSYVVNNYLMGKDYEPFDLLYWNSDPTNVPARWHLDYLRDLYRDNRLARPGGITVQGQPIDLKRVGTPVYIQAGSEDHIAPARSVWKMTRAFSGPVTFMLAGSGHIAGVINPPSAGKYGFWAWPETEPLPETLEEFRARATYTQGSWWPHWWAWLAPRSGALVPAREPGTHPEFPALDDAPGAYVRERVA